jgi:hypothetical protein
MHPCVRATKETEFFKPGTATKYFHVKKLGFCVQGSRSNPSFLTSEFQRWYKPPDLSVESIPNLKSKILKPPHLSVGSISNLKSQI